jgi:hypothetical protein
MFVQVFQGKAKDANGWMQAMQMWERDLRPKAVGFLGGTGGITDDGRIISMARFESAEAAAQNSSLPGQAEWFEKASAAIDGELTFHDCREVDTLYDGGSDAAGFVQIMQMRVKDPKAMRAGMADMAKELHEARPDLLGAVMAWHADGHTVTQASYFTSEEDARINEKAMSDDPTFQEWASNLEGDVTFFDLTSPQLI